MIDFRHLLSIPQKKELVIFKEANILENLKFFVKEDKMTNPVSNKTSTPTQNPSVNPSACASPLGVASQPSSLSSLPSHHLEMIKIYPESFSAFIKKIIVGALEGIRKGIGTIVGWLGGGGGSTTSIQTSSSTVLPPVTSETPPLTDPTAFSKLPITEEERQKIFVVFNTLGEAVQSWFPVGALALNAIKLERIKVEIYHVHPLKLLECLFNDPKMIKNMDGIRNNSITWRRFVNEISEKLTKVASTLPECKIGFAKSLNINIDDITPFFNAHNWEGLTQFLIDVKLNRKTSVWVEQVAPQIPIPPIVSDPIIPIVPQPSLIASLPFDETDQNNLNTLINNYFTFNRFWLACNYNAFDKEWRKVGDRNPLKVLSYLYEKPQLMNQLKTITTIVGTGGVFNHAISNQLSRFSLDQVRPYTDEFIQKCKLNPEITKKLIEERDWNGIIEDLLLSHDTRI